MPMTDRKFWWFVAQDRRIPLYFRSVPGDSPQAVTRIVLGVPDKTDKIPGPWSIW